jgi:hypothetical protein
MSRLRDSQNHLINFCSDIGYMDKGLDDAIETIRRMRNNLEVAINTATKDETLLSIFKSIKEDADMFFRTFLGDEI